MVYDVDAESYISLENRYSGTVFIEDCLDFTKIYCTCGRIADIDSKTFILKRELRKPLECAHCRNVRIANEISLLDEHFNVREDADVSEIA